MINEDNVFIFLMFCSLCMSEEKNIDIMTYAKVSCGNIKRIKAISKKRETFNDVVTKLLDYYEDLQREDLINIQSNGDQCKEQIKDIRQFYTSLSCF